MQNICTTQNRIPESLKDVHISKTPIHYNIHNVLVLKVD